MISSRPEVFCINGVLGNFGKFTGKRLCQSHLCFFNKGLRPAILFKKRLLHRCFPVNFAKFLRTPFLTEHLRWLLQEDSYFHEDTRKAWYSAGNINISTIKTFRFIYKNKLSMKSKIYYNKLLCHIRKYRMLAKANVTKMLSQAITKVHLLNLMKK